MIERLLRSEDFVRVLGTRSRVSSPHFAVHHLAESPASRCRSNPTLLPQLPLAVELSTGRATAGELSVDDLSREVSDDGPSAPQGGVWLGTVVPKRHARRAVTRSLLKRQMHQAAASRGPQLPAGIWVLRLRAPFDRSEFPSAASDVLKRLAGAELVRLLDAAVAKSDKPVDRSPNQDRSAARRR